MDPLHLQTPPSSPQDITGVGPQEILASEGTPVPGQQMVTSEEKQVLLALIQKIKDSLSNLGAQDFAGKDKADMNRRALLHQVFNKLQLVGVDLTDRQSVSDFIANLRQQSPELADQFEKAMSVLLGEEGVASSETADPNMNQPIPNGDPNQEPG